MGAAIQEMFDGIAHRYDLLNHVLSAGRDTAWRKKAVLSLGGKGPLKILDLCGGTGDFWKSWADMGIKGGKGDPGWGAIADFSLPMLREAGRKFTGTVPIPPALVRMDALRPAFKEESFDAILCGYGMRNLDSLEQGIGQVRKLLKPGGIFVTLEFFRPATPFTRFFYERLAPLSIPLVGGLFSSRRGAYAYLVNSIRGFCTVKEYQERFHQKGFRDISVIPCDFGISHIVTGVKA